MPIIKSKCKVEKEQVRINIDKATVESIKAYCKWADDTKLDDFFEQAANIILKKDKEWKEHLSRQPATL